MSFGIINHFLYDHLIKPANFKTTESQNNYRTIMAKCPEREVNFVMNPKLTYPNDIHENLDISRAGRNVECILVVDKAVT